MTISESTAEPTDFLAEESDLIARAQAHDQPAFERLVQHYYKQVFRIAFTMLKNPRDAEEVTQETFLNVFRKIDSFRGESKFSSWLYRVTANFALMRLRKNKSSRMMLADDLLPQFGEPGFVLSEARDWSEYADQQLENKELGQYIHQAIYKLPDKYRIILTMRDVDGLSNEEISQTLGMSIPAVKSILHRARLFVREELSQYFGNQ